MDNKKNKKTDEPLGMGTEEASIYFRDWKLNQVDNALDSNKRLTADEEEEIRIHSERFRKFMKYFNEVIDNIDDIVNLSLKLSEYIENNFEQLDREDLMAFKSVMTEIRNEIQHGEPGKRKVFPTFIEILLKENLVDEFKRQVNLFNEYMMQKLISIS